MILTRAVGTTAPEVIYRGILDDLGVWCCKQNLSNICVSVEFLPHGSVHDFAFVETPIWVGLIIWGAPNFSGEFRGGGGLNLRHEILKLCPQKLVCLVIMFDSRPGCARKFDGMWWKVGKTTVAPIDFVEVNRSGGGIITRMPKSIHCH